MGVIHSPSAPSSCCSSSSSAAAAAAMALRRAALGVAAGRRPWGDDRLDVKPKRVPAPPRLLGPDVALSPLLLLDASVLRRLAPTGGLPCSCARRADRSACSAASRAEAGSGSPEEGKGRGGGSAGAAAAPEAPDSESGPALDGGSGGASSGGKAGARAQVVGSRQAAPAQRLDHRARTAPEAAAVAAPPAVEQRQAPAQRQALSHRPGVLDAAHQVQVHRLHGQQRRLPPGQACFRRHQLLQRIVPATAPSACRGIHSSSSRVVGRVIGPEQTLALLWRLSCSTLTSSAVLEAPMTTITCICPC